MDSDKPNRGNSLLSNFVFFFVDLIEKPIVWFRETVVEPNRKEYYWYHERLRRVPTIDECRTDDLLCNYEADCQFVLDRMVDKNILHILRKRYERCSIDNKTEIGECDEIFNYWQNAITNFFIKYGDMGFQAKALSCYMKQKHRMAWERRHGPVGSGRKPSEEDLPHKEKVC